MPKLKALYSDLFSSGKGLRSKLVQKVSSPLRLKKSQILLLSQTIEFIHHASLLHDDLVDRNPLRRNKKAAWLKYSPEQAVLAGDYLLTRVMVKLSKYGNLPLIQYTSEMIAQLVEGEWIQDSLFQDWEADIEPWNLVHHLKTSSLFKWCLRAPFFCLENKNKVLHSLLEKIGDIFGLLFQRSDDLLDFDVRNDEKKSVLVDLRAGYLNSFGCFLKAHLNKRERKTFKNSKKMEDIYALIGRKAFERRILEFDCLNKKMIEEGRKSIFLLEKELLPHERSLLESLLELLNLLYWRKKAFISPQKAFGRISLL